MMPNFLKRWFGKRPGTIRTKPERRERFLRPRLELLEDRVMLDAGLPSAIVVGKTLSAYSVAAIQNHQETITYTVYNEQAAPVSGVLLTDTLQPGLTIASASKLPDQSGQDLAWSLGTIPGFGRASVSLTLALPDAIPAQLDGVTRAFGTLNGQMVSAEARASTLRTDIIPGDLLASTPDANWNDPFIQAKAAELGYDPQRIFDYLDNEVGYNSYNGSLRGARGTLWSSAGNALDVASLGVALMRASGIPAQYVSGTLSQGLAQDLILSMFPSSYQTVGYIPEGTEVADPANDPTLLAETENHYWFQFDIGNGMVDADPLMPGPTPIGQTFTIASSTFTEVPDELREKTHVTLTAEVYYQSDAAFGLDPFHRTVVLDQTFNDVELVGRPLSVGNFVNSSSVGSPVFGLVTNTYSPYLALGDQAYPDPIHDHVLRGLDFQEQLTNFPLGNQIFTGLFLDVTLSGPQGPAHSNQVTLLDRIGYDVRQHGGSSNVAVSANDPPAVSPLQVWSISVLPGLQDSAAAIAAQENLLDAYMRVGAAVEANDPTGAVSQFAQVLIGQSRAYLANLLATSDYFANSMAAASLIKLYSDRPRITLVSANLGTRDAQTLLSFEADLLHNSIRSVVAPGQATSVSVPFQGLRGIVDSVLEALAFPQPEPGSNFQLRAQVNASAVFQAAAAQGIPVIVLLPDDANLLDPLPIDAVAKARITTALQAGLIVIVPAQDVIVGGEPTVAWFEINAQTGEAIGVGKNGAHQGLVEYSLALAPPGTRLTPELARPIIDLFQEMNGSVAAFRLFELFADTATVNFNKRKTSNDLTNLVIKADIAFTIQTGIQESIKLENNIQYDPIAYAHEIPKPAAFLKAYAQTLEALFEIWKNHFEKHDPPVPTTLADLTVGLGPLSRAQSAATVASSRVAGLVEGSAQTAAVSVAGSVQASWASAATSSFLVGSLSTGPAVVTNGAVTVGVGNVQLPDSRGRLAAVAVTGSAAYDIAGSGGLSFYGPAESSLGVSGDWGNYAAAVTGNLTITLTTDSLLLNANLLPAGTYTITTNAATLSGSGLTSSPNFSGSVAIAATDATINLGPGSGNITVGGNPVDPANGITLTGYSGDIAIAAGGTGDLDDVSLNGDAANVLTVSATPAALTTDQNTPVSFQVNVNTSFAGTYDITAQAPPGWTAAIDGAGNVTATPAPGLQDGTFAIQIIAQSTTNPELVAQTTVPITITPTEAGITFAVNLDPIFTVPFNDAQVPTAFQAVIHNNGPTADTYNLSFANIPAGFTLLNSGTSVIIPAGETGIVGLYLQATTTLPAPGTPLSFDVTATSASNPAIAHSVTTSFTMPEVHAVTLVASPPTLSSTPGAPVTTTLTLKSVGNVAEDVTLAVAASTGLTVNGLTPIHLGIGQSMTQTVTLTPAGDAPVNSTLTATFTVPPQPGSEVQPSTTTTSLVVRSPEVVAISQAAVAAGQVPNFQLAATLGELAGAVAHLQSTPTDASVLARVRFLLGNLSTLLSADPALTGFVSSLQPLQASDAASLLAQAPAYFGSLADTLAIQATQQFTITLSSTLIDAEPGQSKDVTVELVNIGDDTVTLDLSASGLPSNVTASFGQTQVTLAGGATETIHVTLANTLVSAKVFTLEITAAASVSQHSATAVVAIRPAVADVLSVTVNPASINAGDSMGVTAQIFNAANVARGVLAHIDILDAANHVVSTLPDAPISLVPGSGNVIVDLGQVSTAGLANGLYSLEVSLRASDNSPVPGLAARAIFAVGQLVTATVAASAPVVAPGTSTVATTISVANPDGTSNTITVGAIVPGTSDPYLAGMPFGSVADGGDTAPAQSPVLVRGLPLLADNALTFGVTGSVKNFAGSPTDSPDGGVFSFNGSPFISHFVGAQNGISDITAPINSLVGVFLGPNQPSLDPAPAALDFSSSGNVPGGLNYLTLSPQLQQLFFIGDGRTAAGQIQEVVVPAGASRLFLAAMDGTEWRNNTGSFSVQITAAAVSVVVAHDLPDSGYSVDLATISPAATSSSASQVMWNALVPNGANPSLFQLSGTVDNMAPGEVRTISLGTTVTTTVSAGSAVVSVTPHGDPGQTPGDPFDISTGVVITSNTPTYPGSDIRDLLGGAFSTLESPGRVIFADRGPRQVDTVTFTTPSPVAIEGFHLFLHDDGNGSRSSTNFALTVDGQIAANVFIMSPGSTYRSLFGSDAIEVTVTFAPVTGSVFTAAFTANTGPHPGPRVYELDAIPASGGESTVSQTVTLQPLTVAAEHIISLEEAVQSAERGAQASYILELKNPYATDQTYLLSSDGLAGLDNDLPTSVFVPAGQTVVLPLNVAVPQGMTPGVHVFQVFATTATGAIDSVEGQLTVSPEIVLNSQAVHVALHRSEGTAGQGTSATFTLRITNEGNTVDTYDLSAVLPAGVTAAFSQMSVVVPPGQSNFREVTVTLTPTIGALAGAYSFQLTAGSATNAAVSATATGMLTVLETGVQVALTPTLDVPGSTFTMTVTNTGQVTDTFDLALAGPAAFVANLGAAAVTLAPGATQVFPISTGPVTFATPGFLPLSAMATSQANPAVRARGTANLRILETQGMTAEFEAPLVTLEEVAPATFLLLVHNTGNTEDAYSASITSSSGPVVVSLTGLDGQPTQLIPVFHLPGLFTGAILVHADLTAPGQGTVTVEVKSLSDEEIVASATATVIATVNPTVTVTGGAFVYDGQAHPANGLVKGYLDANLGVPTFTYTDANNVTTSTPPVASGAYSVTASFAGAPGYAPASATTNIVINPATPTVMVNGGTFSYDGQPHPAAGSVVGIAGAILGAPTFAYADSSNVITSDPPVNPGTYTVTAAFAGNANYTAATNTASIVITDTRKNIGILLLDQSGQGALTSSGNGSISVTGGGAILVNSSNSHAAIATGNGQVSAAEIDVTGTLTTGNSSFQGVINTSAPPTADPLASLPQLTPAMFVTVSTSTLHVSGINEVTLQPGRYVGGIKISGRARVTLAGGVYYLDGGGFSVTGQATLESAGGVLIYNAPRSSTDSISFAGQGDVRLTGWLGDFNGLTPQVSLSDAYKGLAIIQDRSSTASISLTGPGNVTITGSIYGARAAIKITGKGSLFLRGDATSKTGAHLIVSKLLVTGIGGVDIDTSNNTSALW